MEKLTIGNRYLFDTCVFIDIIQENKPATTFYHQTRYLNVFAGYSILTEAELLGWPGIKGLRTEHPELKLLKAYQRYFVNVTIAQNAGRFSRQLRLDYIELKENLKKERKQPTVKDIPPALTDCLIAATAKFYDLRLVSRDTGMLKLRKFDIQIDMYQEVK